MKNIFAKVAYDAFKIYETLYENRNIDDIELGNVKVADIAKLLEALEESESEELINKL